MLTSEDLTFEWKNVDWFPRPVALAGSRLTGLATETSDWDYIARAYAFPPEIERDMLAMGWSRVSNHYERAVYENGNRQIKFLHEIEIGREQQAYLGFARWPSRLKVWAAIDKGDPTREALWDFWKNEKL